MKNFRLRINKDSIVLKIIFYTNIAIVISSIFVATIITFITFKDMESKLLNTAKEKVFILEKANMNYMYSFMADVNQILLKENYFQKISEAEINKDYRKLCGILKNELIRESFKKYYKTEIAFLNENGKILGYTGERNIFIDERKVSLGQIKELAKDKIYYIANYNSEIYLRSILSISINRERNINGYLIVSTPLDSNILEYMRDYIELSPSDRIFILSNEEHIYGDFNFDVKEKGVFKRKNSKIVKNAQYFFKNIEIDGKSYYITTTALKNINGDENLGYFGIGISRENFLKTKIIIAIFIGIMVLSFVTIATTCFSKLLKEILLPLKEISDAAEDISNGKYDTVIDFNGKGEIKVLETSLKGMLKRLEENQKTLKIRNKILKENLNKMKVIEKLILGIEIEDDIIYTVKKIMKSFVSESELGFARAMFFRYSRERDALVGEMCILNSHITEIRNDILKERKNGFDFQINKLEDVIKLIKIPFSSENFITTSLKERKILYMNDKGYKHNLGNDLFNSIGLKNFIAIPIYNIDYYTGVMLFDYYTKEKQITEEDVELIKILIMNVATKLKNKVEEKERIDFERNRTINNITERFLTTREEALNRLVGLVQENKSDNLTELEEEIKEFKEKVKNIKYSNKILKQYSNPSNRKKLEPVNIEHFIVEVIEEFKNLIKEEGNEDKINIASFISYTGDVLGNRERFRRAFIELLKNAYDAVLENGKTDKKITIIVIRDKLANKIKIDIKDNGIGMNEEQLKDIFQPFMTYKGDTPGLGIPLAERVIKDCKGVIKIYSTPNQGTEVKITLNIFKEDN
ncbi:MAG: ATP-binding protein [Fusobacterium perfoetens]|uniref:ATP-binding protein n=2 Tax=Fusobacterium perfoetens TaxID=852 RepID=UPI0023EFF852|nr:ATP-binding protein [Fusobacterium perfoetens]MCI6152911.1 ATP-binding protein [Fusobacterium perfoetens]MDY3237323.1 ATP-binding protein [Fusobacterium perfoetens]